MPRSKPTAVTVIAILQLVFGGLGLFGAVVNLSGAPQQLAAVSQQNLPPNQRAPTQAELEQEIGKYVPHYHLVLQTSLALSGVLCLLMIGSGVGLLRLRPWGRSLAITYAVLSIAVSIASIVYQCAVVLPGMAGFSQEMANSPNPMWRMMAASMSSFAVFGAVLGAAFMIYPIIVLIIMLQPSVRAAFRGEAVPEGPEDYRDAGPPGGFDETDDRFRTDRG
jgi:hypothetical protein